MENIIYLCALPFLDNSYTTVIDFSSLSSQNSYFDSKVKKMVSGNFITDSERDQISVALPYQAIKNYDYLFLIDQSTKKRYYYFIMNKSYKTSNVSILDIELDVFSTYLFDHELLPSFIDRAHVPRWNGSIPTEEIVDEGLPNYDYVIKNKERIATMEPSWIITSTAPLGKLKESGTGGGGEIPPSATAPDDILENSAGSWRIPASGTITATYPNYPESFGGGPHHGIDIANVVGTPIFAAKAGTVVAAISVEQDGFGKYVKIDHGGGVYSYYAHCSEILCAVGQQVAARDLIAKMGSTGISTGPHVHFEIRVNGYPIDPDPNNVLPVGTVIK